MIKIEIIASEYQKKSDTMQIKLNYVTWFNTMDWN